MQSSLKFSTAAFALSFSAAPLWAADLEAGREVARQCIVCHGKLGIASDPTVPNLAGQPSFYIEKSLKDYQSGARSDPRMTLMAQPLSDEDIKNVAAWYESFEVTVTPPAE